MYHWWLLLALVIKTAEMDLSCAPGEITKPYTFTYTFNNNDGTFFWKKNGINIVLCENDMCTVLVQADYNIYEATISNQNTTLKIKAVTRDSGGSYSFGNETYNSFTCSLRVYEMNFPCAPGEVTQPYTFTYPFSNNSRPLLWTKNGDNIFTCSVSQCTLLAEPGIYEATRSGLSTTLTIKAVTIQSSGIYSCDGERFSCSFRVYAKPNTVTCLDPELQTDTNEVAVVGTVLGVYPNPVCKFSWFIDNKESRILQNSLVEYNNLSGCGETSYCNQTCSFKVPARNFTRGKHQFQLLAYPNVTGQGGDTFYGKNSTQTSPKIVADPNVTLVCSETTVQEFKLFSCTCKEIANAFILPTTTLFYGAAPVSSALQQVTANVIARRNTLDIICQTQLPDGTSANKTQTVQVYFGPTIFIVEANNNSGQIILEKNSDVSISCQAEGNPSPSLSLKKDRKEIQPVSISTHKSNRTLTYNKAKAECMDTGVYMCHAETDQAATNETVAVYVKCAQQFRDPANLSQNYKQQVNGTVLIIVTIFGYPEPNVTLKSNNYMLSSESYKLNYTKQEPPFGTVSLEISIRNASFFQNYSLNINNSVGALNYLFEIVKGDPVTPGSEKGDVGAIVGGIVAAVLVIIIIFLMVYLVKRKGAPCSRNKDQTVINSMHAIYENDESENSNTAKDDANSRDAKGSRHDLEELPDAQAPENPHYEEIIDFRSDMPEKSVYYANQISSNARNEEVEYENTVISL